MKKLLSCLFVSFCFSVFADQKKMCQLGQDPADSSRLIDWNKECIVKPIGEKHIRMSTGSGKIVECFLPPLTPVVVEKNTGLATWIFGCGNEILQPKDWMPQGAKQCAPSLESLQHQVTLPSMPSIIKIEGEISHKMDVSGEVHHIHEGEIVTKSKENYSTTPSLPTKKSWWQKNRKWVIPLAILGGAAAGYAVISRDTKESTESTTIIYQPLPPPIKR